MPVLPYTPNNASAELTGTIGLTNEILAAILIEKKLARAAAVDALKAKMVEALKAKFPADALTRADDLAKRAETALTNNNPRAAARYYRDAR